MDHRALTKRQNDETTNNPSPHAPQHLGSRPRGFRPAVLRGTGTAEFGVLLT